MNITLLFLSSEVVESRIDLPLLRHQLSLQGSTHLIVLLTLAHFWLRLVRVCLSVGLVGIQASGDVQVSLLEEFLELLVS